MGTSALCVVVHDKDSDDDDSGSNQTSANLSEPNQTGWGKD